MLFPVGPGLGVLSALGVRLLTRVGWPAQPRLVWKPLAAMGAMLGLSLGLPGAYVWGERNNLAGPWAAPR